MKPILVTCYLDPDLDGTAGAIAYAEFLEQSGRHAVAGILGRPHEEARYVLDRFGFAYPQMISNADDFDQVILVDSSDLIGLEGRVGPEKVIEIIDHRKAHHSEEFPNAKAQIELVGAAATLVAEKFMPADTPISLRSATLLASAIISNTLNFKASVTTDRDIAASAWLSTTAKLPRDFWKDLFLAKSDLTGDKLAQAIRGDYSCIVAGGKTIGIAQIEMIGARKLLLERGGEILNILNDLRTEKRWDMVFQSTIDLEECKNYFITDDSNVRALLEKTLKVTFTGTIAERSEVLMRKQIVPLLINELGL